MAKTTKKERYSYFNSMVCLVKALENKYTTIDLRNESYLTGKILHVDGYMNIELENVIFCDSRGAEFPFDSFFVKARNIRYVHIPTGMNAVQLIGNELLKMSSVRTRNTTKVVSFKSKRAQKYHQEIVQTMLKN